MLHFANLLLAAPLALAAAHHGWADDDTERAFTLSGTIERVQFVNPHVPIRVSPADDTTRTWLAVLAPPARMNRRGMPSDSVQVGRTATLYGYPHKEITDEMRAERITINGRTAELR
jgi:hypothetical protein